MLSFSSCVLVTNPVDVFFVQGHILPFWHYNILQAYLEYFLLHSEIISHFSKEPWLLILQVNGKRAILYISYMARLLRVMRRNQLSNPV